MLLTPDRRLPRSRNDLDSPFAMDILGEKGEWRGLSASPAARYRASSPIFSPLESPAPPRSPPPPSPPMPTLGETARAARRALAKEPPPPPVARSAPRALVKEPGLVKVPPPVPDEDEKARRKMTMNAIARAARRRDGARVVGNAMRRLSGKQRDSAFRRWHVLSKDERCEEQEERTDKVNTLLQAVRQLEGRLSNALVAQQDVNKAGAARLASGTPIPERSSHGGRAREYDLTEKLKTFGFFDDFDVAADTVNDGDYYASDSLVAEARRRLRKTDPKAKEVTSVKDDKVDPRNLSDIATDLDAALGTLTQRLSCTDLLPQESQAYETPLYDATPSHVEMKGPQTLSQISETLDAALYTFTKSYQAKEAAEKAAQEEIEKQRGLERAEIEKEIRAKHSLELMEAAIALGECDAKIEGERREDDAYLGPIRDMRRSLDGEEPLPPARRAATLNDAVFHYPPAQPPPVPFLPLGAMQDTSLPPPVPRVEQRPTGSLNDVSQGIGAELDLALGLMQKRLGAEQMVAKDGDIKPDAKPKVMEDPELKGALDEDEKKKLMRKEIEEFEKRVDDAEKAATARREQQVDDLGSDCSSEPRDEPGDLGLGGARAHRFETEEAIDRFLAAGPARPPRIVDVAARPRSVERPQPLRGSFERYDGGALPSRRSYERRSRSPPRTYERRSRSPPRTYERRSRSPRVSYPQSPFADLANIYDAARDRHERVSYKRDDRVRVVEERAAEADLTAAERLERVKTLRETVRKDLRGYEDGTA